MAAFMRCSEHGAGRSIDGLDQDDPATVKSQRCEAASPYRQKRQDFKKQDSREEAGSPSFTSMFPP
jgi:hypothetical protein